MRYKGYTIEMHDYRLVAIAACWVGCGSGEFCLTCYGAGFVIVDAVEKFGTDVIVAWNDYIENERIEYWLNQRYGTPLVSRISDYWMPHGFS